MEQLPLRDIHLPDVVSVWPPALGWWLLLAVTIALLATILYLRRRVRVRRTALSSLKNIEARFAREGDARGLARDVSTLVRRVCLTYRPRREVAGLTGAAWRRALATQVGPKGQFSDGVAQQLCEAPYNPRTDVDAKALIGETRRWMRALPHRPGVV